MRFANSLMLRLAIRVRFADAGLAKEYAEKAVKHPAGLIDSKELAAQMGKGAGLQMKNPLKVINEEYNDTRMGAVSYTHLDVYKRQPSSITPIYLMMINSTSVFVKNPLWKIS